ncbi:MAG: YbaN family protein [Spirochaetes bacterium]|nr:YbaN family protein [Spirochaetota bacterium]
MSLPPLRRLALQAAGWLSLALGVLGIFLPLLPTTPFLLLTAFCWARSSPRFHRWLMTNRFFGGSLSDYLAGKGVPLWQKLATLAVLWISLGVSARLLSRPWVSLLLLAVAIGVTLHVLLFQKTRRAGD